MKIGVMVDSFKLGLIEGVKTARRMGAEGIQLYAVTGETAPDNMSKAKRKEFLSFIKSEGITVTAVCGDPGGHGFADPKLNPDRIVFSKKVIDLALDLECNIVTTHIGVIPSDQKHPRYSVLQAACDDLGRYGDTVGAKFAIETGPETAPVLKNFIESLSSSGVRVNMDPANFVMVTGQDPVEAVQLLAPYIVHTHAKDGRMLIKTDPEKIYGFFADGGIEDMRMEDYFIETPLGEGTVNFDTYLAALKKVGFDGWLTIEREAGVNPVKDIEMAVRFLQRKL